jgi:hypothetical protein
MHAVTVREYFELWIADKVPPMVRKAQARDYRRHVEGDGTRNEREASRGTIWKKRSKFGDRKMRGGGLEPPRVLPH